MNFKEQGIGINVQTLINLVSPHEALYNPRHVRFRDKKYTTAVWKTIATELGTSEFEAKTKWQNLRSNFMRERRKLIRKKGSGQTWVFLQKALVSGEVFEVRFQTVNWTLTAAPISGLS
uniref:Transcription factor Adf-1 n=1 Tax=Lygus hesperus TaxID=30085 RepID=A0A0A9YU53_LYGHE